MTMMMKDHPSIPHRLTRYCAMSPSERENRDKRMNDTTTRAKDDKTKTDMALLLTTSTTSLPSPSHPTHTSERVVDEFSIRMMNDDDHLVSSRLGSFVKSIVVPIRNERDMNRRRRKKKK